MLQDHFHPPLSDRRHWHSFHNAWATYIASDLNQKLPAGYFAEPNVQFGIEIDVATFEDADSARFNQMVDPLDWTPPVPDQTVDFVPTAETVEITIFGAEAGLILTGAIELISPANKDRPGHRQAFVAKCETYLRQGIGLVIVDVVTTRTANLHQELLSRLQVSPVKPLPDLYAAAYRVIERHETIQLDIWQEAVALGRSLPVLPLWLQGGVCLPVDLKETYDRTCREQRILPV